MELLGKSLGELEANVPSSSSSGVADSSAVLKLRKLMEDVSQIYKFILYPQCIF